MDINYVFLEFLLVFSVIGSSITMSVCFSFLVGGDGTVYEGRGWGVVGAHTKGHNHDSLGIAFMGNYNSKFALLFAL